MRDSESTGRVLLVTDAPWYHRELVVALSRDGLGVDAVTTCREGLLRSQQGSSDIVLLDSALSECSHTDLCDRMLGLASVPVVLLGVGDRQDVVLALEQGAADCVTNPDRLQEVVSRVRAILRRTRSLHTLPGSLCTGFGEFVGVGPIGVDIGGRRVHVGNQLVHLSRREFDLLAILASPPGLVRTREELIDRIWLNADLANTRTLDKHIQLIRNKIEPDPKHPSYLVTVRRVGFCLRDAGPYSAVSVPRRAMKS